MADLILLHIDDHGPVRCTDLDDAERKIKANGAFNDKAVIKWTPEGGGPVSTPEYSLADRSWVAHQS